MKASEKLTPAAIAGLTKPATIWRTMAQASSKAAIDIFTFHAPTLAQAYTSPKQLENALQAVSASYGLNKIFKAVLKHCKACKAGESVADIFELALVELSTPKERKTPEAKPADVAKILEMIGTVTDTAALAQIAKALQLRAEKVTQIENPEQTPALV